MTEFLIVIAAIVSMAAIMFVLLRVFSWFGHRGRKKAGYKLQNRGSSGIGSGGYVADGYGDSGGGDCGGGD